jgi:hypothetical protein
MPPSSSNESPPYDTHSAAQSDHGQGPPRKKMRKGTKSCLECRRRKIKCTFEPGRTAICNECYARGSTCIDQEHGDLQTYAQTAAPEQSSYSLRERVAQLEDLVKQVLHKAPDGATYGLNGTPPIDRLDPNSIDAQAAEVLKSIKQKVGPHPSTLLEESIVLPGGVREYAPALSLFDNAVISRKELPPAVSRAQYNKSKALVTALKQLLPCPADLDIILEAGKDWWQIWRKMFPEISDHRCQNLKESVSHSLRSERPAEVAKIMLCIANSVYQMPAGFDWSRLQLKESPEELMERYINTVNRLVIVDDEIAATIDGIECIVLESKYHINMGRPRRAWLLMRRAIAFAQLLGLHRLSSRTPAQADGEYARQVSLWCHLFAGEKFLSLMLGLPYSVQEQYCEPYMPGPNSAGFAGTTEGEIYLAKMIPIITKVIDRNQSPTPMPYAATLRIDQDIEELYNAQDPAWWTTSMFPGATPDVHFDRLQAQFYHHQMRVFLHMPFMLKSSANKRYQYSHTAALESARQMIRYYEALRSETKVGPFICKLIDFQAFTAAMLLLLNLCGYAQQSRGAVVMQPDLDQDQQDSALIDITINLLQDASKEAGGIVAQQSYKALEMVAEIRHGCDEKSMEECAGDNRCQISIPYFGTVTMAPGKNFVIPKAGTYPKPGEPRKSISTTPCMNTGLPTPPSLPSVSTQPSPLSANTDRVLDSGCPSDTTNPHASFGTTDWVAPGMGNVSYDDVMIRDQDPFVMFDSFMALPPQQDFPTSTESSGFTPSGFTPAAFAQGQSYDPIAQGFPWATTGGDLDQSWNWFTGADGMH